MSFKTGINRTRVIAEALIFGGMSLGIVNYFGLKNESLLLSVLIFGIYLVVSGRISEFKFMDLDVKLKNAENRPVDELTREVLVDDAKFSQSDKGGENELHAIILPKLIREGNKLKVLKIMRRTGRPYDPCVLSGYLKYFTHVVFVDKDGKFSGFASGPSIVEKIKEKIPKESMLNFINANLVPDNIDIPVLRGINEWKLDIEPIKKEFVVQGTPRKQVLDKMNILGVDTLPVVSADLNYEGFIDRDTIISQITREVFARSWKGQ